MAPSGTKSPYGWGDRFVKQAGDNRGVVTGTQAPSAGLLPRLGDAQGCMLRHAEQTSVIASIAEAVGHSIMH